MDVGHGFVLALVVLLAFVASMVFLQGLVSSSLLRVVQFVRIGNSWHATDGMNFSVVLVTNYCA